MSDETDSLPGSVAELAGVIPVFPLTGVLLLPRGMLPLNIFEPRYLAMTRDAIKGSRLIGMIQPTEPETRHKRQDVYRVGCVGQIVSAAETDDGRILITLRGLCRFAVARELEDAGTLYRQVEADYDPFAGDLADAAPDSYDRPRLLNALRGYCERQNLPADWESIHAAPDMLLVHSLCMICPFTPGEKQALLEAADFPARATMLITLLEMALLDPAGPRRNQVMN